MFVWQASLHTLNLRTTMNHKSDIAAAKSGAKIWHESGLPSNPFPVLLQHDKAFCVMAVTLESASPKGNEATTSSRVSIKCSQKN